MDHASATTCIPSIQYCSPYMHTFHPVLQEHPCLCITIPHMILISYIPGLWFYMIMQWFLLAQDYYMLTSKGASIQIASMSVLLVAWY